MKSIKIMIAVFMCFGVGYYCGSNQNKEIQDLQIEKTKLSIKLLKRNLGKDVLTIDDLDAIFDCVDTRIENQHSKIKFPCTSVRGDSI